MGRVIFGPGELSIRQFFLMLVFALILTPSLAFLGMHLLPGLIATDPLGEGDAALAVLGLYGGGFIGFIAGGFIGAKLGDRTGSPD